MAYMCADFVEFLTGVSGKHVGRATSSTTCAHLALCAHLFRYLGAAEHSIRLRNGPPGVLQIALQAS
jgi:hypothetical protein